MALDANPKLQRWFLLNTGHANYNRLIGFMETRHKDAMPDNELSVVLNDAATQSLVKVSGADLVWRRTVDLDRKVIGRVPDFFDRLDHHRAMRMLAGPDWSNTRRPI